MTSKCLIQWQNGYPAEMLIDEVWCIGGAVSAKGTLEEIRCFYSLVSAQCFFSLIGVHWTNGMMSGIALIYPGIETSTYSFECQFTDMFPYPINFVLVLMP